MNDNARPEALELVGTVSVNVSEALEVAKRTGHGVEISTHSRGRRTS
jgi:hypothetical protein